MQWQKQWISLCLTFIQKKCQKLKFIWSSGNVGPHSNGPPDSAGILSPLTAGIFISHCQGEATHFLHRRHLSLMPHCLQLLNSPQKLTSEGYRTLYLGLSVVNIAGFRAPIVVFHTFYRFKTKDFCGFPMNYLILFCGKCTLIANEIFETWPIHLGDHMKLFFSHTWK